MARLTEHLQADIIVPVNQLGPEFQHHQAVKTIISAMRHFIGKAVCVGCILLLAATANAQVQYNFTTLSLPPPPGQSEPTSTWATCIDGNNVVGYYGAYAGMEPTLGFVYNNGSYTTFSIGAAQLGTTGPDTYPSGISGNYIVGQFWPGNTEGVGVLYNYNSSSYTILSVPGEFDGFIGGLTGHGNHPTGVSGNNVVGSYNNGNNFEGFLYNITSQSYTTLPFVPSGISGDNIVGGNLLYSLNTQTFTTLSVPGAAWTQATAISGNNIVGTSSLGDFLYNGSSYSILNLPGAPSGISGNDIVGSYYDSNNISYGYLATPVPGPGGLVFVPEPAALTFLALGVGAFCLGRRRRPRGQTSFGS